MKNIVRILLIYMLFMPIVIVAQEFPTFKIMTEQWQPYNFRKDGRLQGISVELFTLMLKKVNSKQGIKDIELLPWPRAYGLALNQKNTVLFSMTRTTAREKLFKWVGPIHVNITELFARRDKHIVIKEFKDIFNYKVGTIINDVGEQVLVAKGLPLEKCIRVANRAQLRHMLHTGRIDITPDDAKGFVDYTKDAGYKPNEYESVYILNKGQLSFAFNRQTPDSIINAFQKAFDQLKKDGSYKKIMKKYNEN